MPDSARSGSDLRARAVHAKRVMSTHLARGHSRFTMFVEVIITASDDESALPLLATPSGP